MCIAKKQCWLLDEELKEVKRIVGDINNDVMFTELNCDGRG